MTASFSGPFFRIDSFVSAMNFSNSFVSAETSLLRVNRACNSNRIIGRLSFHAYLIFTYKNREILEIISLASFDNFRRSLIHSSQGYHKVLVQDSDQNRWMETDQNLIAPHQGNPEE